MHCYYHRDEDAVGLCKACGRGLCPACVTEFDRGLACRGRCEEATRSIISILVRGERSASQGEAFIRMARGVSLGGAFFTLLMGGVLTWYGLFGQHRIDFVYYVGILLMVYGAFLTFRWLRSPKPSPETPDPVPPQRTQGLGDAHADF